MPISGETTGTEDIREKQLLKALREEHDKADQKTDQNDPTGFARPKQTPP